MKVLIGLIVFAAASYVGAAIINPEAAAERTYFTLWGAAIFWLVMRITPERPTQ